MPSWYVTGFSPKVVDGTYGRPLGAFPFMSIGKVVDSLPDGFSFPVSTAAIGFPSTVPVSQASKMASALSFQLSISMGAPVLSTTMKDRKSTRLNSSHVKISYAVFCLKKKIHKKH